MKRTEEFTFEIPNWSKYNPRNDYKSMPWVRLQVNLWDDASVSRVTTTSTLLYVYLITQRAASGTEVTPCSVRGAAFKLKSKANLIRDAVDELERNQLVKVVSRSWSVRDTFATKRNETKRTNERNGSKGFLTISSDGEKLDSESSKNLPEITKKSKSEPAKSAATWESYSRSYRKRYGVDPIRNRTINSQLKSFVERVGEAEAPEVASYFVTLNDPWYTKQGHTVGILLRDCEKIRTLWATKRASTEVNVKTAHVMNQLQALERGEL